MKKSRNSAFKNSHKDGADERQKAREESGEWKRNVKKKKKKKKKEEQKKEKEENKGRQGEGDSEGV